MNRVIIIILLLINLNVSANDTNGMIEEGFKAFNFGNRIKGIELMQEVLKQDPENIEALWLLAFQKISSASHVDIELDKKAKILNFGTYEIQNIINLAHKNGKHAKAHYIASRLARLYFAYERAIAEIDKAIAIEPDSARYYKEKGMTLYRRAKWERNEEYIAMAIDAFDRAVEILDTKETIYTNKGQLYFSMARWYPVFAENSHASIIDYYRLAIETGELTNKSNAFAWNNLSNNYREVGKCLKAKDAAEKALSFFEFGMAKKNLYYSESCLELDASFDFKL